MTSINMVNWPAAVFPWKDSGEGGLYTYLIVVAPEDYETACIIDCNPWMNVPDVCLNPPKGWWPSGDYERQEYPIAVLFIGSTSCSLCGDGEYFMAHYNDLTSEGKALYSVITNAYEDCTIRIVTFLDT